MTQEALNIAGQCRATASSPLAKNILVDEGNGLLTELLLDAARIIEALAQPEQEPVAWATREDFYRELDRSVNRMRQQMEIKGVVMRYADYDIALPVIDIRDSHVLVGQVTTPPQTEQEPVAWLHWLHGPVRVLINKDEAMMELDRLNREYPVDKNARQMKPLYTKEQL